jgi:hypothetical protein
MNVKRTWVAGCAVAAALCAAVPAGAQELRATIPFDFTVGKTGLPAGGYTIDEASDPSLVSLRSIDGKAAAFTVTIPDRPLDVPQTPELVFVHVGNTYRLESIVMGDDLVRDLPMPAEMRAVTDRVSLRMERERPPRAE